MANDPPTTVSVSLIALQSGIEPRKGYQSLTGEEVVMEETAAEDPP